ncbi:MAG: DUF4079 domain-containing protein [Roseofilum sp. SBFL]|uniref:DUF4079 domain-containing protein n=1 Tax=unclassified Roseofilum TaxID=2620099 RepID=UPI001B232FCC|nr:MULTISPECIES: DUF4079 domain-containing protein [unclassified Roseofilum]MBP0013072.1 DUF4079 domain-containing protein [Roseofilum sp. SID3]MBP0025775.1 DUF4079 domain-containing protein [Roseofilum sp. SID2]MBP0038581.1 DUF4079 domain-containing protein [Roseofilum sp. SID1]MBP0042424.1 DUF4079 domain-containing protein [Roseofilum sp. SBFL]
MDTKDILAIIHPTLAVALVYPLIGIVVHFAWQTRQRRLAIAAGEKSKIPTIVGPDHVRIGQWLTGSVVGISLVALAYVLFIDKPRSSAVETILVALLFAATITSLVFLFRVSKRGSKLWRGVFATGAGMGLVVLGCQDGVFRRGYEWYISHYYYGITAALLMIFSLAIVQDIYRDRSHKWRMAHIILNCVAVLLFFGQGFTGSRDLLELPLDWQKPYVYQCKWSTKTCPQLGD